MSHTENTHPDQKYIIALLTNNRQLLDEIYTRFAPGIIRYIQKNNGQLSDAKDIFHEALISIFQRVSKKDFQLSCPFEAYLFMVCKNLWINELKRRGRHRVTNDISDGYTTGDTMYLIVSETNVSYERKQLFEQKFTLLSEACQQLLRAAWQQDSMQHVAESLNISYAYARKKKSECISRLAQLIKAAPAYQSLKA